MRPNQRANNQTRPIKITRHYTKHAEGSVLVEFGDTKVLLYRHGGRGRTALFERVGTRLGYRGIRYVATFYPQPYAT